MAEGWFFYFYRQKQKTIDGILYQRPCKFQPPRFNNLPSVIEIDEETSPYVNLFTINVTDPTNDDICCTLERVSPQTENFIITVSNGSFWVSTGPKAVFSYKSINSYIVRLCCEDDEWRTSGFLQVKILKPEKFEIIAYPGNIICDIKTPFLSICPLHVPL